MPASGQIGQNQRPVGRFPHLEGGVILERERLGEGEGGATDENLPLEGIAELLHGVEDGRILAVCPRPLAQNLRPVEIDIEGLELDSITCATGHCLNGLSTRP